MQYANHEDEDEHSDVGVHRYEEHRQTDDRQRGVGPPEDADFAFPVGERLRQCRADQVADTIGGKEGNKYFWRTQDPGDVIHHRPTANADGQDIEDGQQADNAPLIVLPDVAQVFTHRGGARRRFHAFFGGEKAKRQHQERHHREHGNPALKAERFILAANQIHQRHHQHGGEHAARRRQHEAP